MLNYEKKATYLNKYAAIFYKPSNTDATSK